MRGLIQKLSKVTDIEYFINIQQYDFNQPNHQLSLGWSVAYIKIFLTSVLNKVFNL